MRNMLEKGFQVSKVLVLIALPHGVVRVFWGRQHRGLAGSSLRQGQIGSFATNPATSTRAACLTVWSSFRFFALEVLLPGGVTGSTGGFGPPSSGSSPDRVVFLTIEVSGF